MNSQPTVQFAKPLSKKMKTHFSGSNQSLSTKNFLGSDSRHIRVFTPTVSFSENQYLTCLWSSVIACGVEGQSLQLHKLIADRKIGDVIHLHWIHDFCPLVVRQTPKTLFHTLRNLAHPSFLKAQGHQIVWTIHTTLSHKTNILFEKAFKVLKIAPSGFATPFPLPSFLFLCIEFFLIGILLATAYVYR